MLFVSTASYKGQLAVQGHSRPPADFGTNRKLIYDFLIMINTNLPSILHCFGDTAFYMSKIAIFVTPLAFRAPNGWFPLRRSP